MEVPGPLFSLSVGCFGKQDSQICGGGGGNDVVDDTDRLEGKQ